MGYDLVIKNLRMLTVLAVIMVLGGGTVSAQDYPNRPIRIVTTLAGSGVDFVARAIAPEISVALGQPVIVDNRAGGSSLQGALVLKAPPNGYTLLVAGPSFAISPLMEHTSYDPVRDFSPITLVAMGVNILVVHPSLPVNSVKEIIALAKAKPGVLNYATTGTGSGTHLSGELFKAMAGVDIVRISYQSPPQGLNDLVGGQVQLMFASSTSAIPFVKSGRLRAVAVTSAQPSALAPGLPTVAASGLPGYELVSINSVFAPGKTPATIIKRLNQEIVRVVNKSDVKEKFLNLGLEAIGSSPDQLELAIKTDLVRWSKLIKEAGLSRN